VGRVMDPRDWTARGNFVSAEATRDNSNFDYLGLLLLRRLAL
jgi:hypothetical protein